MPRTTPTASCTRRIDEEKVSLSERFGLWLSFYPFRQDDFLDIVDHWLARFGVDPAAAERARRRRCSSRWRAVPFGTRGPAIAARLAGRAGLAAR